MARQNATILTFNRGRISPLALARTDLDRTRLSAEIQTNWMPRTLGSMMLRPGWEYIATVYGSVPAVQIPLVFNKSNMSLIELTNGFMRVLLEDEVITRSSVSTTVTNGTFDSDIVGWTDADESGATSSWGVGGYLSLIGTRYGAAIV